MAVNPDPTVTNLSLTTARGATVSATVTVWEIVAVVTVPQQTITLPAGRWLVTLMVVGLPGAGAPAPQTSQQDVTLAAGGTVTLPATNVNHLRDFTSARSVQVLLDVQQWTGSSWVPYDSTGVTNGTVTLPAAAVPAAGSLPKFGASNDHVINGPNWQTVPQSYLDGANSAIQAFGGTLARTDNQWSHLCPSSAAFDATAQANYDTFFNNAAAKGIKVIVNFQCSIPNWGSASKTFGPGYRMPATWSDYSTYITNFIARWGSHIAAFEMFNEPAQFAGAQVAPADYVTCLQHMYAAVKATGNTAPVLAGCLSLCDLAYLGSLYAQAGFRGNYDAISIHPYCLDNNQFDGAYYTTPIASDPAIARPYARREYDVVPGITAIHELMRNNGDGTVPIWITEMGWKADWPFDTSANHYWTSYDVSEAQQATFQAYVVRALSRLGYVNAVHLYSSRDAGTTNTDGWGLADYWGNRQKAAVSSLASAITALNAGTG